MGKKQVNFKLPLTAAWPGPLAVLAETPSKRHVAASDSSLSKYNLLSQQQTKQRPYASQNQNISQNVRGGVGTSERSHVVSVCCVIQSV